METLMKRLLFVLLILIACSKQLAPSEQSYPMTGNFVELHDRAEHHFSGNRRDAAMAFFHDRRRPNGQDDESNAATEGRAWRLGKRDLQRHDSVTRLWSAGSCCSSRTLKSGRWSPESCSEQDTKLWPRAAVSKLSVNTSAVRLIRQWSISS